MISLRPNVTDICSVSNNDCRCNCSVAAFVCGASDEASAVFFVDCGSVVDAVDCAADSFAGATAGGVADWVVGATTGMATGFGSELGFGAGEELD
jgi:hypothetical protein